jgi:transposase
MVRLSDAGWSVPRIARHLGQHEQTVRAWIKAFLAGEFEALPNKPRGGKESALSAPMLQSVSRPDSFSPHRTRPACERTVADAWARLPYQLSTR